MLRIYRECLQMVREVRPYADRISERQRAQAEQLRESSASVPLNVAEGSGVRGGRRRQHYEYALGSARETLSNLQIAEALGYIEQVDAVLLDRLDHIIATLVKNVK